MRRYRLAAWMLRSAVPQAQAEGIVGDIAELSRHKGFVFWGHITRVLTAFLWWPTLVFLLTLPLGFVAAFWMDMQAARHFWFVKVQQPSLLFEAHHLQVWNGPLWALAAFALLRYGPSERAWMLSAGAATLMTGLTMSLWLPSLSTPVILGVLSLICWTTFRHGWRWPSISIFMSVCLGVAVQYGAERILALASLHHGNTKWLLATLAPLLITTPLTPICYAVLRREAIWNKTWRSRLSLL